MNETDADLEALQQLLDRSYASAGAHLTSIHTPERRLTAVELAGRLTGMCLLTLATTTSDGRPLTGPVDGVFLRGQWWFGSAPNSLRARHLARDDRVSATYLPGEHLGVVAHGRAVLVGVPADLDAGVRAAMIGIYGDGWNDWGTDAVYWRLVPDRMFTFSMDEVGHIDEVDEAGG